MVKQLKRLWKWYINQETVEAKTFWTVSPLVSIAGLYSLVSSAMFYTQGDSTLTIYMGCIHFVVPLVFMLIAVRLKDVRKLYALFSVLFTGIIMPVTFLTDGGIYSGMPLFCLIMIMTVTFITYAPLRIIIFSFSLTTNVLAFALSFLHPELVIPVSEEFVFWDVIIVFILLSCLLLVLVSSILGEYRKYVLSKNLLQKYMDPSVQKTLTSAARGDVLPDTPSRKMKVTVVFADISRFTSISEDMETSQIPEFLNIFLTTAEECVHKYGGIVDKYIGDCIMAYWIDEEETGRGAAEACSAVLELRDRLHDLADSIFDTFGKEMNFSAGINYGEAVFGAIGSPERKDFTIIGDAVNVAQRLEEAAANGEVNISSKVAEFLGYSAETMSLSENIYIRGKARPITIYRFSGFPRKTDEMHSLISESPSGYCLYVCGSRGSYSVSGMRFTEFGGETSCYILKKDQYALIIDCGTGLYSARNILANCKRVDVVLTHVHYDHILGLLDWSVFPAGVQPNFYGNFSEWEGMETIHNLLRAPFWPVDLSGGEISNIQPGCCYDLNADIKVQFIPSSHPNHSCILQILVCNFNICFLSDCENPSVIPKEVTYGCDLMLFDGMYEESEFEQHLGWGHSTLEKGLDYAIQQKVKKLIITHHNPKHGDRKLLDLERRANLILPGTSFARAGDRFSL